MRPRQPRTANQVDPLVRTSTEERAMSTPDNGPSGKSVKALAIRLEPDLHQQLSLIAQLRGNTVTDEIREAIDRHITAVKESPEIAGKAEGVLEDIERDAAARRNAIATLLGSSTPETEPEPSPTTSRAPRGRKTGSSEVSG
jgi:predicted DNA-binding protein